MRKFSAKIPFSNNKLQTGSTKLTNDNTEKNLFNLACRWLERDGVQLILSKLCGRQRERERERERELELELELENFIFQGL